MTIVKNYHHNYALQAATPYSSSSSLSTSRCSIKATSSASTTTTLLCCCEERPLRKLLLSLTKSVSDVLTEISTNTWL